MKFQRCRSIALVTLLVASAFQALATPVPADGSVKPALAIEGIKVAESKAGQVALEVTWSYVEQEQRPKELSIIAILIGARGKEYKSVVTVPVPKAGKVPTSSRVVIPHAEPVSGPSVRAKVTLGARVIDGTSNTFAPVTKEIDVRLAP